MAMIPAMTTGMMDFMMSSGLITDMAAIPVPLFAVPYAAPNAGKGKKKFCLSFCTINGKFVFQNHAPISGILLISHSITLYSVVEKQVKKRKTHFTRKTEQMTISKVKKSIIECLQASLVSWTKLPCMQVLSYPTKTS